MTPRALFEQLGGFDRAFEPAYSEDVDYCLRLWQRGKRVIFNPESLVIHAECDSPPYRRFLYVQALRNMAVLHKRYREYLETVPDYGTAPVSSLDGKRFRSAWLLIVDEMAGAERPAWADTLERLLAEQRFVTVYALRAWRGHRENIGAWLPAEVEVVSRGGKDELEAFCRERSAVYEGAAWLAGQDGERWLRQWLRGAHA